MRITSEQFQANVRAVHGDAGASWLADIPRLLTELEHSWDLRINAPYELSYNYVAPAMSRSGTACVVKLTVPGFADRDREVAALTAYSGRGAVDLLDRDDPRGALLLERGDPGRTLAELGPDQDAEATAIICSVMQRLWCAPPSDSGLPSLVEYGRAFADYDRRYAGAGPVPARLVEQAGELLEELSATSQRQVLLHGDLHHHNVLQARRETWLAIDPHGLIGDPGFDVGAMLYNPVTSDADQLLALLPARLQQISELTGLQPERVAGWGLVMAVLSEVWSSEDSGEIDGRPLAIAESLSTRLTAWPEHAGPRNSNHSTPGPVAGGGLLHRCRRS